jgi:hypothetical protein
MTETPCIVGFCGKDAMKSSKISSESITLFGLGGPTSLRLLNENRSQISKILPKKSTMKPIFLGCEPEDEPPWDELDVGICETVRWLWTLGFQPTDSGDGKKQGDKAGMIGVLEVPHVFMICAPSELHDEADRLYNACGNVPGWFDSDDASIQATYFPVDNICVLELYGMHDGLLGCKG